MNESKARAEAVNPQKEAPRPREAVADPVGTLERLEDEVYTAHGISSRPAGKEWAYMVLDLGRRILDEDGLLEAVTPADLEALTEDNFHTARHAAEVVLHLKQYIT